jgi:hypothetical protein
MRLRCPICDEEIDSTALRMEWGPGGGFRCPSCGEPVRISQPYRGLMAILSLLIAGGILMALGIHSVTTFLLLTALMWVPVSLLLNTAVSRVRPPTLKKGPSGDYLPPYQIFQEVRPTKPMAKPVATTGQEPTRSSLTDGTGGPGEKS